MICHLRACPAESSVYASAELDGRWMTPTLRGLALGAACSQIGGLQAAKGIGLTFKERQRLGVTTIGAIDLDKAGRAALRKKKARRRMATMRRKRVRRSGPTGWPQTP